MKKIISSILIIAIVLSLFTTVSFAASSGVGIEEEVALLQELGILEDAPELDNKVTRAEFVKLLANFLRIDYSQEVEERYYMDISEDEELWNITGLLVKRTILTVPETRLFRPDDNILLMEAACALMKGYGAGQLDYALYTEIASKMNLLKGVSYGELTYKDVITLLYNALVGYPLTYTGNAITPGNKTYMEMYYDMFYVKGVVNAVNDSVIDGNGSGKTESIRVGNLVIDCDIDNPYQYLGKNVGVFYTSKEDPQLRYIYSITDDRDVIKITEVNEPEFDERTFTLNYYDEKDKQKKIQLPRAVTVIFNGTNATDDVKGAFERFTVGSITVITSGIGEENDIVIIDSYYTISVMSVNATEGILYGKDGKALEIDPDTRPVYIEDVNGNEMSLSAIANGNIVSVFESEDYLKLVVSNTVISGEISKIQAGEKETLFVAGNGYELFPGKEFSYALGAQVSLSLDHQGYIAEISAERKDDMTYGWITAYEISDEMWEENSIRLKVFTEKGVFTELRLAEKTRIDGITRKTSDLQIYGLEQGKAGIVDQMILFKADSDNLVKEIDTVVPDADRQGLKLEFSNAEGTYGSASIGKLIWTTASTVVFVLPSEDNRDNEEAYVIGDRGLLEAWGTNEVDSYRSVDHDKPAAAEVLVLKRDMYQSASTQKGAFIVDGIHQEWDMDGEETIDVVTLMSGSAMKEYHLSKDFDDADKLVKGNIVTIGLNGKNELSTVTLLYGVDEQGNVQDTQKEVGGWSDALHYIAVGQIVAVGDEYADLSVTGDGIPTVRFPISTTNIGVYDTSVNNSQSVGTKGDLTEAMMRGDIVALSMYRGTMLSIAIVKY